MRRNLSFCLALVAATSLVAPAASSAKPSSKSKAKTPQILRVTPMRVGVGELLTIRGSHFKAQRNRNTVIFRGPSGRTVFVKPRRSSTRRLVVQVKAPVARLLKVAGGRQKPTRLKLRVLAGKFSRYTPKRLSPVVTGVGSGDPDGPGPGPGGVKVCRDDADHDNDLLSNDLELAIKTDPCLADTDGDTMTDGWEYYAAKDLNIKAVPYPGKRPFPNALDPSDGANDEHRDGFSKIDFDGDGLSTLEEYRAWRITGSSFVAAKAGGLDLESPLGYSDGTKYSRASEVPSVPNWQSWRYGLANPPYPFPATFDLYDDPQWRDSERDADRDGLANRLESARGPRSNEWQAGFWAQEDIKVEPWAKKAYCGQRPGHFDERPFANLDLADSDVDGDNLLDGEDDQDNDDYSNILELYETEYDLDGNGAGGVNPPWCGILAGLVPSIDRGGVDWAVNAMNPCVPNPDSRTCHDYIPF